MVYYRSDLLEAGRPGAAQDLGRLSDDRRGLNGKDLNGDGKADYGSCIAKKPKPRAYWLITSVAGSFIQSQGTGQGVFFDTRDAAAD